MGRASRCAGAAPGRADEITRLLRKLSNPSAYARVARCAETNADCAFVYGPGNDFREPSGRFAAEALVGAQCNDWVTCEGDRWRLSRTGAMRLRRELAGGDAYQEQHQQRSLRRIGVGEPAALVNDSESPLAWLRRRKDRNGNPLISQTQFSAGERLRADYTFAQLQPRVTASWSCTHTVARSRRSGGGGPSDAGFRDDVIAARDRVRAAIDAVGPELAGVLTEVCCELKGLEEVEKRNGWPQRSAKVILGFALRALARHYGLTTPGRERAGRPAAILHWGSEDYRPEVDD